ncbi:unnamed protein product [Angiostrongylus costaricensis]|uniref:Pkinase_Tyr domain-containing protein n=1 Tax=Angiostrongylus costaricensis TaxID=334426 RepID=A0A0R3PYH3_ANGCS|nr:unnamed protein product [Angiostrongylus costaricensis]
MVEEAQMMSYYVHEHIVEVVRRNFFYGLACDRAPILIVMEYCPGGNLESHLKKQKECIEVGERVIYALEVILFHTQMVKWCKSVCVCAPIRYMIVCMDVFMCVYECGGCNMKINCVVLSVWLDTMILQYVY